VFELFFNGALLAYKAGDFQVSHDLVSESIIDLCEAMNQYM
jgi:hypothetical protein